MHINDDPRTSCFGREQAVVSRLAAIEVLAGIDMLCSGQTGKSLFTGLCLASASDVVVVSGATDRTGLMFYKFLKELNVYVRGFIRNVMKARERLG